MEHANIDTYLIMGYKSHTSPFRILNEVSFRNVARKRSKKYLNRHFNNDQGCAHWYFNFCQNNSYLI